MIRMVEPAEVEGAMLVIEPGLTEALHRSEDWTTPEVAKGNLLLGKWCLFLFLVRERYAGFAVVEVDRPKPGEAWGNLVFVYTIARRVEGERVRETCIPLVEEALVDLGCTHLRFFSARAGGRHLAEAHGYAPRFVEYVKEVQHDQHAA